MRAVSRLSINAFIGRGKRSAMLTAAVALSTALVAAIACSLRSLNAGLDYRLATTVGLADLVMRHVAGEPINAAVVDELRADERVALVSPRLVAPVRFRAADAPPGDDADAPGPLVVSVRGIEPDAEARVTAVELDAGRPVNAPGEVVLDELASAHFNVGIGDELIMGEGDRARRVTVVGVRSAKTFRTFEKPEATIELGTLRSVRGPARTVTEVAMVLTEVADADAVAEHLTVTVAPKDVIVRTTTAQTSGIDAMTRGNTFMFALTLVLAYLASGFIVLTGMTTGVLERQRELATLRCVGASRWQLAAAQLLSGGLVGGLGAAIGLPIGVALAWTIAVLFPDRLPAGLHVWPLGLTLAGAASVGCGVLAASWPAFTASRAKPLAAMRSRASPPAGWVLWAITAAGIAGVAAQAVIVATAPDAEALFFRYMPFGLPAMFVGYFLLGVPVALLVTRLLAGPMSRLLRLPPRVLGGMLRGAPYRNGFTAGALMIGLAMMTSIWTNGNAILKDWIGAIRFPDAFVNGLLVGLDEPMRERIEALPIVEQTAAITVFKTNNQPFGIPGVRQPGTTFIAFEPEPFFEMTKLSWEAGDPETALPRLKEGGAILVTQEFLVQREGFGVGRTFGVEHRGRTIDFEIVGAVSSPGLDIVRKYFDFEDEYAEASLHAVFGTREDLKRYFGTDTIHMFQIGLAGDVSDADAVAQIEQAVDTPGVVVGSGREVKERITEIGRGSMRVAALIAVGAMLIGCAGVANVLMAGIDARRFEFGVLRAVGLGRGALARLLLGETLLIAITAGIIGTAFGLQGAWAGVRLYETVAGLRVSFEPPAGPIALGWATLIALTLAAVTPIVLGVARQRPRTLLASRG